MRALFFAALVLVVLAGGALMPALAAPGGLLLEVWRNGATDHALVHVRMQDGRPLLAASDFASLGINVTAPPGDEIDLTKLTGVTVAVDEAEQRLLITLPARALPRQLYDLGAGAAAMPATPGERGALLRYDLSANVADMRDFTRTASGGISAGLDLFRDRARLSNSFFAVAGAGGQAARLDSTLTLDRPENLTRFSLGDGISAGGSFGRAVRFGGLEYASDFSLTPGLVTTPLPSFFGASDVPATVDVYSGAARMLQQEVAPGPFEIRNLPIVTGGGTATVVVRDMLGRETTQSLSLFTDRGLLTPGLDAFALDLGFRRRFYGVDSFAYDTPVAAFDWRRGMTARLTAEAHGEAAPDLVQLGGGGEWSFGRGSVSFDAAASQSGAGSGFFAALSAQLRSGWFNLYGSGQAADGNFRDLAARDGALPPRWRLQGGASADMAGLGVLALSWIGEKRAASQSLLSASWSLPLPHGIFLSATALRDFTDDATSAQLVLSLPLGTRGMASAMAQSQAGRTSGLMLYDTPADPDGGVGYRLAYGAGDETQAQAEARYVGPHVGLDGGVALAGGAPALRADAGGALLLLRGGLFAVHDPGEAVALVETGAPGIRIYRENRPVAVSDANGQALLTGLVPYGVNHIGVDARDYPFTALVEKTDVDVAPPRRGAVLADLRPASRHPLLALVTRGIDMAIPAGATVRLDGEDRPLPLGHDGRLFLADFTQARGAEIDTGTSRCRVYIKPQTLAKDLPTTPPLLCLREASGAY